MKPLFNHRLIPSFALYLEHNLLNGATAYTNTSGTLYPQVQSANGYSYASPYKGWVYDSCVSGAAIPSGVYDRSGNYLTRSSGIVFDWDNGRVLSNRNLGNGVSGTYARRDYNFYVSTEEEVGWWMEKVYGADENIAYTATGANPYRFYAPCVILTNAFEGNENYALGGLGITKNTFRAYIISNSFYQQEGITSYFRDLETRYFSLVNYSDVPITASGDIKGGYYCYDDLCAQYGVAGVYIEDVFVLKLGQRVNRSTSFSVAVAEFDTSTVRQPGVDK